MAFISYSLKARHSEQHRYVLTDSEFGDVEVDAGLDFAARIAREYAKRGLPVGRNLALLVLYTCKEYGSDITSITLWQDTHNPVYELKWNQYAEERDRALEKLLALK